ncbi:loader and inhibitor of phage g40p [Lucifera butyrica]|uniref:Loader and inhibitor of phage g40p n=1 Tax=Lucifera butyrica TaxID=1351585 RepID=A0A498RB82_9FIRM|nr:replicative helicase loader/inhibitor [Lucifera butyrica]VBB08147.1 loader and inhibitor of phage g40p [Lucifera butyrica]
MLECNANMPTLQDRQINLQVTVALWQKMLADFPYSVLEQAVAKVIMQSKIFPTVAEIREAAESLMQKANFLPSAEEAWDEVMCKIDPYRKPTWSHCLVNRP